MLQVYNLYDLALFYGIDRAKMHLWESGATSVADEYYLYKTNNAIYTGYAGTMPDAPDSNYSVYAHGDSLLTAMYQIATRLAAEAGFTMVGRFDVAGSLFDTTQVVWEPNSGKYYSNGSGSATWVANYDPTSNLGTSDWIDETNISLNSLLASADGCGLIGSMSYAQLRAYSGSQTTVNVWGISNFFDGASGTFKVNTSDTTSADNGGTILVDASGRRWYRVFSDVVSVKWFGVVGDGYLHPLSERFSTLVDAQVVYPFVTSLTQSLDYAGIQAALNSGAGTVEIPDGTFLVSEKLTIPVGVRVVGRGQNSVIKLTANISLIDQTSAFVFTHCRVLINSGYTQTATVIKLDANTGSAYQMNSIDLTGTTVVGNNADCVAFHFKCTNGSYMAYNNMHDLAVVAEGVQQACILLEVDNSGSYIQGNTFGNLNLIRGGVRYIYNGAAQDTTLMKGNTFTGTFQIGNGEGELFEQGGVNVGWLWDSQGYNKNPFLKDSVSISGGFGFYELVGDNEWSTLTPRIHVVDGWGKRVERFDMLATGVTSANHATCSKAKRGRVEVLDPCINALDARFSLTGMSQAGEVMAIGNSRRSSILLTNTVATTADSFLTLPNSATTLAKFPEFKIGFRKEINGFYGSGTPTIWNPRLDAEIGLLDSGGTNGLIMSLDAIGGTDVQKSTISLIHRVGGVDTILSNSLSLLHNEFAYLAIWTDNDNVYMEAVKCGYNTFGGYYILRNTAYGLTSGVVSVARPALFNNETTVLDPIFKLTSTDKEIGRAKYHIVGIEYARGQL